MKMRRWKKLYGLQATFLCPYCLKQIPLSEATRDHIVPRSRGGKTEPDNIVLCCKYDNARKGALTAEEYAEWKRLEAIRNGQQKGR